MILVLHTYISLIQTYKQRKKRYKSQLIMTQASILGKSKSRVLIIPCERKALAFHCFFSSLFKEKKRINELLLRQLRMIVSFSKSKTNPRNNQQPKGSFFLTDVLFGHPKYMPLFYVGESNA